MTRLGGLAVSRALGDHFLKRQGVGLSAVPHVSPVYELSPLDSHVIIASDGLWDTINGRSAAEVVLSCAGSGAAAIAQKLLKQALASFKCCDNVTVIVVALNAPSEGQQQTPPEEAPE